jgi:hypothetical protein
MARGRDAFECASLSVANQRTAKIRSDSLTYVAPLKGSVE